MARIAFISITLAIVLTAATAWQTYLLGQRIDQLGDRMIAMSRDLQTLHQHLACSDCRHGPSYAEARR